MREIPVSEMKQKLAELVAEAERGNIVVITRHGRAIARLIPEPALGEKATVRGGSSTAAGMDNVVELRRQVGRVSVSDIGPREKPERKTFRRGA